MGSIIRTFVCIWKGYGTTVRNFSERLTSERERLGLTQKAMAEVCGVSIRSQSNYESGERMPDATYLAALAAAGADVLYVLTGSRSQPVAEAETLSPRQRALLSNYENTDEAGKRVIESTADFAAQPKRKRA